MAAIGQIEITTSSGSTQKLNEIQFQYSDEKKTKIDGYFQIYPDDRPNTSFWVDLSKVEVARFNKTSPEQTIICTMVMDNGESLTGRFHDPKMRITGKNELGEVDLDIKNIEEMKFTGFGIYTEGKLKIVDRKTYLREQPQVRDKDKTKWVLSDGKENIHKITGQLYLWDSYNTDFEGWDEFWGVQRLDDKLLRWGGLQDSFLIDYQGVQTKVKFTDIDTLEISGKTLENKPEVSIGKGEEIHSVGLYVRNLRLRLKESETFGPFDSDDYLVWDVSFGYEGLALAPLREIAIKKEGL